MDLQEKLEKFLREYYHPELVKSLKEERSLTVDFSHIDRYDAILADELLENPERVLNVFNVAAATTAATDEKINVRIRNLPESRNIRIRNLRAVHLGRLWSIDATIKAASEVKPQIYEAIFECPDCKAKINVLQTGKIVQKPAVCECGRRGDFTLIDKKMFDIRWLKAIEPFEITTGEQPGEITVLLKEDLTTPKMQKKTDPGSNLKLVGIVKEIPKHIKGKLSTNMDTYVETNHVETSQVEFEELEITPENEKQIRDLSTNPNVYDMLRASIAPGIFALDDIKDSVVLQLFGGLVHVLPDGSRVRGNIHILITGDPGVGKTQLLKLVSSAVPRGRYVSGTGASGAGLTATVVKNEAIGGWVLEAGALILCNKGLIAIDEFDKMNRDDQIAMHEATSVETVSIAKASIVATLPAQTAVLAGANPKFGRFDPYTSIGEQIQIPETLLSRFDLKFALRDIPDKINDEQLAAHIIISRTRPDMIEPPISMNLLRKYIAYARQINSMELSEDASGMLKNFYVDMRNRYGSTEKQAVSITLRQYEALIRLAEASAKVRLDNTIRKEDAERAIRLMMASLRQLGYDTETQTFDVDMLEGGVTSSKRTKLLRVLKILDDLQKESKEVAIDDLKAEAENQGVEDVDDVISRLEKEGMIIYPRPGFIRKI
ncbi:MAG TPA: minichromosome maintenance protein MCM [Candidatus Aenigmarchaeota archaeon]|nr:minichromosome maintenance protein MCM [Candidatus Aenigmarchaeota archaeon]